MASRSGLNATVLGAGPNGLAAAITLARAGRSVHLIEARPTVGGACSSAELTLPGFTHDVGAAIHPLGIASPFFRTLDLASLGLQWIQPPVALAHPLDDGSAAVLLRSTSETANLLGRDRDAYLRLMSPLVRRWDALLPALLGPVRLSHGMVPVLEFGRLAMFSAAGLARWFFRTEQARALFAGLGAHSILPLERPGTAAYSLLMGAAGHACGWPIPTGGSQKIADALRVQFVALGGRVTVSATLSSLDDLSAAPITMLDVTPRQLRKMGGRTLSAGYRAELANHRYGPAAFKVDWALSGPVPWRSEACRSAGTVHLGGTIEEVAAAERDVSLGRHPERPFVILAQPSLFDPTRAPSGMHTVWAYCHVPNGSPVDMTSRIEDQIERFAPGFREAILARNVLSPAALETYDANLVGGDIAGGSQSLWQLFVQPALRGRQYTTAVPGLYVCSASMPPGAGVHGMCGYHAARKALADVK